MKKLAALAIVIPALVSAAHSQSFTLINSWGTNGSGPGEFNTAINAKVHNNGYVYIADHYNHNVQRWTTTGQFVDSFGTLGTGNGQFDRPHGMAFDVSGNVYVADQQNMRIQVFNETGQYLRSWGTPGSGPGQFSSNEAGLQMTISKSGFAYVADPRNQRIQKFNLDGTYISEWGTGGSAPGQFFFFGGIDTDSNGNVYVADVYNNRIQKFDENGTYLTEFSALGLSGSMSLPYGICTDKSGHVFVSDAGNKRLLMLDESGNLLATYGSTSDNLIAGAYNMGTDSDGRLFVTDPYSLDGNQIKVFQYGNPSNLGAVPEPSEWAAMGLLGAGLIGLVIRGRKKNLEVAK
jgi:sugar lactone lactonase YvrE